MNSPAQISQIEKLTAQHSVNKFRCGKNSLDHYLRGHALKNQTNEASHTYVIHRELSVVGYMTLLYGSVSLSETPGLIARGMPPNYSVPVMILARWAVAKNEQGKGIGRELLKEAFLKTAAAADIAGLRAILVDAIDDEIAGKYREYGFLQCSIGPHKLMLPIEVIRASL